jgi:hypothetical protein
VQAAVQTFTRVCCYDRAEMVKDLHVLLQTADIRGPYVLVGHSFGGLLMRLFAQRFPQGRAKSGTFLSQLLVPAARRKDLQNRWDELQARFLELSCNATQTFIHRSGHFMQRDCPEVIVETIAQAVGVQSGPASAAQKLS